jgi:uncharacterized protein GlcG (DUF336 family)
MATLTLSEAEQILAAAKAKVLGWGAKMGVSVVDARGDLIAMFRVDGALWRTALISRGKAAAAAAFGRPSGELADNAQNPVFRALMELEGGHFVPGKGALPVYKKGELVGAVGGSGGTAEQDEEAARAGIEAAGLSSKG